MFSDRKSVCLLPVNLNVLPKNRYVKSWKGTINIKLYKQLIATYDKLLALDNKLKTHQRDLPLKYTNLKTNFTQYSCGKHISRKVSHIHGEGVLPS